MKLTLIVTTFAAFFAVADAHVVPTCSGTKTVNKLVLVTPPPVLAVNAVNGNLNGNGDRNNANGQANSGGSYNGDSSYYYMEKRDEQLEARGHLPPCSTKTVTTYKTLAPKVIAVNAANGNANGNGHRNNANGQGNSGGNNNGDTLGRRDLEERHEPACPEKTKTVTITPHPVTKTVTKTKVTTATVTKSLYVNAGNGNGNGNGDRNNANGQGNSGGNNNGDSISYGEGWF